MKRRALIIPAVGLAVVLASFGRSAEAGYVSSGLASVSGKPIAGTLTGTTSLAVEDVAGPASESQFKLKRCVQAVVVRLPMNFGPSGGMTPPAPEWSGSQPVVILQARASLMLHLAAWLGPEGRSALPPPLSTGIFRPPRFVG